MNPGVRRSLLTSIISTRVPYWIASLENAHGNEREKAGTMEEWLQNAMAQTGGDEDAVMAIVRQRIQHAMAHAARQPQPNGHTTQVNPAARQQNDATRTAPTNTLSLSPLALKAQRSNAASEAFRIFHE